MELDRRDCLWNDSIFLYFHVKVTGLSLKVGPRLKT